MAISMKPMEDEPIAVLTLSSPFNAKRDAFEGTVQTDSFRRRHDCPIFAIWDFSEADIDYEALVAGILEPQNVGEAYLENVRHIFVGTAPMLRVMVGTGPLSTGGLRPKIFSTLEEALAMARGQAVSG
ncbi:MAG: hypothetical protein ACFB51_03820 [Anaerolineae bacterium]